MMKTPPCTILSAQCLAQARQERSQLYRLQDLMLCRWIERAKLVSNTSNGQAQLGRSKRLFLAAGLHLLASCSPLKCCRSEHALPGYAVNSTTLTEFDRDNLAEIVRRFGHLVTRARDLPTPERVNECEPPG